MAGEQLTDHAAGFHSVLVDLTQVVSQVAQLRLHVLLQQENGNKRFCNSRAMVN